MRMPQRITAEPTTLAQPSGSANSTRLASMMTMNSTALVANALDSADLLRIVIHRMNSPMWLATDTHSQAEPIASANQCAESSNSPVCCVAYLNAICDSAAQARKPHHAATCEG